MLNYTEWAKITVKANSNKELTRVALDAKRIWALKAAPDAPTGVPLGCLLLALGAHVPQPSPSAQSVGKKAAKLEKDGTWKWPVPRERRQGGGKLQAPAPSVKRPAAPSLSAEARANKELQAQLGVLKKALETANNDREAQAATIKTLERKDGKIDGLKARLKKASAAKAEAVTRRRELEGELLESRKRSRSTATGLRNDAKATKREGALKIRGLRSQHQEEIDKLQRQVKGLKATQDPTCRQLRQLKRLTTEAKSIAEQQQENQTLLQRNTVLHERLEAKIKSCKRHQSQELQNQDSAGEWEGFAYDLQHGLLSLAWSAEEILQWGRLNHPYPPEIAELCIKMCLREAYASQVPFYIAETLATFFPGLDVRLPDVRTIRNWRLVALVLSDLVAAIKMLRSKTLCVGADATSKRQRHLNIAVVSTDFGPVMCNGVHTMQNGTAEHTARLIFDACFVGPQGLLDNFKEFLAAPKKPVATPVRRSKRLANNDDEDNDDDDVPGLAYDEEDRERDALRARWIKQLGGNLLEKTLRNEIIVSQQRDHANAAKAASRKFDEILLAEAKASDYEFDGTYEGACGDHKRKGHNDHATKGQQAWLKSKLPPKLDIDEYGQGAIITMLYRQLTHELCDRGEVWEHGHGVENYAAWMHQEHPGMFRPRLSAVGPHYDGNIEGAMTALFLWAFDLAYLVYLSRVKADDLNKLERKLIRLLGCVEVKSAVKAEAVLWAVLGLALRMATNEDGLPKLQNYLDMQPIFLRALDLLRLWSEEDVADASSNPDLDLFNPAFTTFPGFGLEESLEHYWAPRWQELDCIKTWDDDSCEQWKECFKVMCKSAYKGLRKFALEFLPVGPHAKEAGEFASPTAEMREQMSNCPRTNKLAESGFGIYDRLLRHVPNASSVTLQAMTAAKMTKPFEYMDENLTSGQRALLLQWAKKMATPHAQKELAKSAQQITDRLAEQMKKADQTTEKEEKIAKDWAVVRLLKAKQMAKTGEDLLKQLATKTNESKTQRMKFLKLQRKFLRLEGVALKKMPRLNRQEDDGAQTPYTPKEFAVLLGKVLDDFRAGEVEDLAPIPTLSAKQDVFAPFRGATPTRQMQQIRDDYKQRMDLLVVRVMEEAKREMQQVEAVRKSRKKKKTLPALKRGAVVFVADEDDLDPEADWRVWEAIVQKKTKGRPGWWNLNFAAAAEKPDCFDYPRANIFLTRAEAEIDLLAC